MVRDLDPTISEPSMVAKLVTQIDDQALIKVDRGARQIQVHRVVQTIMQERMSAEQLRVRAPQRAPPAGRGPPEGRRGRPAQWPGFRLLWPHVRPSRGRALTRAGRPRPARRPDPLSRAAR